MKKLLFPLFIMLMFFSVVKAEFVNNIIVNGNERVSSETIILLGDVKKDKDAKYVTRQRIYLETLTQVLEGPNKIILDDTGEGQGVVPYLPLNEIKKNRSNNE